MARHKGLLMNLALAALSALALLQTSLLWFNGAPVFDGAFSRGQSSDAAVALERLVSPYRVVINPTGENGLALRYNGLAELPVKSAGDYAIEQIMKRGEFDGATVPIVTSDLVCVVFEYAFPMPAETFVGRFKQRSSLLTSKLKQFDAVTLTTAGEDVLAVFEDRARGAAWRYRLNDAEAAARLRGALAAETPAAPFYLYSRGEDGGPRYLPVWPEQTLEYPAAAAANPYGELTYANLSRYMEPFFDGSSQRGAPKSADGVYMFSTDRTVVRYYPSGALECYFSYQNFSDSVLSSLEGCFAVAVGVLAKDETIANELYLSGAAKTAGGYRFTFDAALNDYPLVMSKELRTSTELSHMAEITVERESVKYRRYAAVFNDTGETAAAGAGYGAFVEASGVTDVTPTLGYRVDGGDRLYLCWFAEAEGREFTLSAE